MDEPKQDEFLTVDELAQRWKIKSKKSIYELDLARYKFKGSIRFKLSDVLEYEEKSRIEPDNGN